MHTKHISGIILSLSAIMILGFNSFAQQNESLTLDKAIDLALQNNRSLQIKNYQVEEKKAKVKEDGIKRYPSIIASSTYQYNVNVGELVIPAGSFGQLPLSPTNVISLPNENKSFQLGQHHTFNAGATIYQPLTQLGKISTGINISKTDVLITEQEKEKASLQIKQAVEKLYYGLLIIQKQKEEAQAKLDLAKLKLYDIESALLSGKTTEVSKAGLQASIADEEQNLMKLDFQAEDYTLDLKRLTGIDAEKITLEEPTSETTNATIDQNKTAAASHNPDLVIAELSQRKTELAIKAAKESYLPDLGVMAGYTYQQGNILAPTHNPYAGVVFKWNIQDAFTNRQVLSQRTALLKQVRENKTNIEEQVNNDIEKAYRKISQAQALIQVAERVVKYRTEELKIQSDKQDAGLNTKSDLLSTKSLLAKAESDLLAAKLNYRLALADLRILTGGV